MRSSGDRRGVQSATATLLTPPGRGALAVVGVAGRGALETVDRLFAARGGDRVVDRPDGSIAYGTWIPTGEAVVVVRHAADRLEVHGHGGLAAPGAVIDSLTAAGCERGQWSDWLADGTTAREALEILPRATAPKPAMILTRQAAGALDRSLASLERLWRGGHRHEAGVAASRLLAAARVGKRLVEPWRVVLVGRVNAGKSSLMNAILGHARSIVSPHAGTTRDLVTATAVLGGWSVELIDTAGAREESTTAVERAGMLRAEQVASDADLAVRVVAADEFQDTADGLGTDLVVLSKADLAPALRPPGIVRTSTVTGEGLDAVIEAIVARLVPEERAAPLLLTDAVPFTGRQVEAIARYVVDSSLDFPRR